MVVDYQVYGYVQWCVVVYVMLVVFVFVEYGIVEFVVDVFQGSVVVVVGNWEY